MAELHKLKCWTESYSKMSLFVHYTHHSLLPGSVGQQECVESHTQNTVQPPLPVLYRVMTVKGGDDTFLHK